MITIKSKYAESLRWVTFKKKISKERNTCKNLINAEKIVRKKFISTLCDSEVFLKKGLLIVCSKFTGENPCWSAI